jgi:hypothetical protein
VSHASWASLSARGARQVGPNPGARCIHGVYVRNEEDVCKSKGPVFGGNYAHNAEERTQGGLFCISMRKPFQVRQTLATSASAATGAPAPPWAAAAIHRGVLLILSVAKREAPPHYNSNLIGKAIRAYHEPGYL